VLFDSNTPLEIETTPLIYFNNNNRHSLDSSIKVILYFLGKISNNRKTSIEEEIIELFEKYADNPIIYQIITEKNRIQKTINILYIYIL
jgi:nitrogenase subunit NifH